MSLQVRGFQTGQTESDGADGAFLGEGSFYMPKACTGGGKSKKPSDEGFLLVGGKTGILSSLCYESAAR